MSHKFNQNLIEVKPYSLGELCKIYGVTDKTLKKWFLPFKAELGRREGRYYSIEQIEIIFRYLKVPHIKNSTTDF